MQPVFWKKLDFLESNFNIFLFKFLKFFLKKKKCESNRICEHIQIKMILVLGWWFLRNKQMTECYRVWLFCHCWLLCGLSELYPYSLWCNPPTWSKAFSLAPLTEVNVGEQWGQAASTSQVLVCWEPGWGEEMNQSHKVLLGSAGDRAGDLWQTCQRQLSRRQLPTAWVRGPFPEAGLETSTPTM